MTIIYQNSHSEKLFTLIFPSKQLVTV